jgi:hypothetical protein
MPSRPSAPSPHVKLRKQTHTHKQTNLRRAPWACNATHLPRAGRRRRCGMATAAAALPTAAERRHDGHAADSRSQCACGAWRWRQLGAEHGIVARCRRHGAGRRRGRPRTGGHRRRRRPCGSGRKRRSRPCCARPCRAPSRAPCRLPRSECGCPTLQRCVLSVAPLHWWMAHAARCNGVVHVATMCCTLQRCVMYIARCTQHCPLPHSLARRLRSAVRVLVLWPPRAALASTTAAGQPRTVTRRVVF